MRSQIGNREGPFRPGLKANDAGARLEVLVVRIENQRVAAFGAKAIVMKAMPGGLKGGRFGKWFVW